MVSFRARGHTVYSGNKYYNTPPKKTISEADFFENGEGLLPIVIVHAK